MAISYVEDYEEVTGLQRETETETKAAEPVETADVAPASTPVEGVETKVVTAPEAPAVAPTTQAEVA